MYLGHDRQTGEPVAIKELMSDWVARIHRDLKPGNILLAEDGTPRLTDFGLAHIGSYPALTTVGQLLGTFQYLSPEACQNQPLDARADIWSFGVVLFEMLTGQLPFDGDSPIEIIHAIQNQPVSEVAWYRKDAPAPLTDLISRMLLRDRPMRLASARMVGAELEALQRGIRSARVSPPPDRAISPQPMCCGSCSA